jgi:prophage maintenance system killer protein
VIISVGYRVKSKRGTRFRIWATKTLRDHLINGYTINEIRLKKEIYTGKEEKVANLLYLTIKNHSIIDGNKRIAASLFLCYLQQNKCLYKPTGDKRIADNALAALCLMTAWSNPKEKEVMIKVMVT